MRVGKGAPIKMTVHIYVRCFVCSAWPSLPRSLPKQREGRKRGAEENAWARGLISHTVALLLASSRACQASQVRFCDSNSWASRLCMGPLTHTHTHSYRHMHIHTFTRTHTLRKLCLVSRLHFTVDGLLGRALWFGQALQLHVRVCVRLLGCFVGLGACMYV